MRKKVNVRNKERILLFDVLPYELPLSFSNRHLYDFVVNFGVMLCKEMKQGDKKSNELKFAENSKGIKDLKQKRVFENQSDAVNAVQKLIQILFNENDQSKCNDITIPYIYKILHKDVDYRELVIIHPRNQLRVVEFIEKYSGLIIYLCSISQYSIRCPLRVRTRMKQISQTDGDDIYYSNSYFEYKYKLVSDFYESYDYHRSEERFEHLFKFDIAKCFDSIYTHSIAWAIYSKEYIKNNINNLTGSFVEDFDKLMQHLSYNETNGIVIGPEFSRIFAEIILQKIDKIVYNDLEKSKIKHKVDYKLYRYVDDYYLFYNEDKVKEKIVDQYTHVLKRFKLSLNHDKSELFNRPIITKITMYKDKVCDLLSIFDEVIPKLKEMLSSEKNQDNELLDLLKVIHKMMRRNDPKIRFKRIVTEINVQIRDILPYTMGLLNRKVKDYMDIVTGIVERNDSKAIQESMIVLMDLITLVFYIYSMAPRVNTTILLCKVIESITSVLNKQKSEEMNIIKHQVYKLIFDRSVDVLNRNEKKTYATLESLFLLIVLKELGDQYWVDDNMLKRFIDEQHGEDENFVKTEYHHIAVMLFYIGNRSEYRGLRDLIIENTKELFISRGKEINQKSAESMLLLFDLLSNPNIEKKKKVELWQAFGRQDKEYKEIIKVIEYKKYWFTKWTEFDIGTELEAKKRNQVY